MTGRISKWKRQKNPERIVLQVRDREILKSVYSFRILSRQQIETLFGFKCTRRVNIRLRKLYDHYYLSRSFLPTVRGSAAAIYYLGPKGIPKVAEDLDIDLNLMKRKCKTRSKLKELFLNHTFELNNLRIAFILGIAGKKSMELERWVNDNECDLEYRAVGLGKIDTKRFRPDGYLRLWYQKKLYSFFIEYDQTTESLGYFKKKVQSYIDYASLGYYRRKFGVKYFRVLVITRTQKRLNTLKKAVETKTNKLFWFTTIDQLVPENVFRTIWQRAGRKNSYKLINL